MSLKTEQPPSWLTFNCSKPTIETLENGVNMLKVINKTLFIFLALNKVGR